MYGWMMDGWMDGGWWIIDGWMDGQMDDGWKDRWTMDGGMDG